MNLETSEIILKDLKHLSWAETRCHQDWGGAVWWLFYSSGMITEPESFLGEFFNTVTESFCFDIYRTAGSIKKFAFHVK